MRIQKLLSKLGVASRRSIEKSIENKEIKVNGKVIALGYQVALDDHIVFGKTSFVVNAGHLREKPLVVIKYHKPLGHVCSKIDDQGRPVVFDYLPKGEQWFMVGRLDINTSGLLLFVNRGDVAHQLMHPSSEIERVYCFKTIRPLNDETLDALLDGVILEDGPASFARLCKRPKHARWYVGVLKEGRNRLVRRLVQHVGTDIVKLRRTQFGDIRLNKNHLSGDIESLTESEAKWLKRKLDLF